MARLIPLVGILTLLLVPFAGCDVEPGSATTVSAEDIIVYGATSCGYTMGLLSDLDSAGLPYTFRDLETDPSAEEELLAKLQTTDWYQEGSTVGMPVVDVKGTLLERPTLEEVEALL